jgi:hypothetical protein
MKAMLIETGSAARSPRIVEWATLQDLQEILGGHVEAVTLAQGVTGFINEDGKALGLPLNTLATCLLEKAGGIPGDHIAGRMLVTGDDEDGNGADLSEEWCDQIRALGSVDA